MTNKYIKIRKTVFIFFNQNAMCPSIEREKKKKEKKINKLGGDQWSQLISDLVEFFARSNSLTSL